MGGKGSKSNAPAVVEPVAAGLVDSIGGISASVPADDIKKYISFRDELFSFALGESAFDYAEILFKKKPESAEVMALLAETVALYDANKNKMARGHWVDRLDLLQRGVDVSRKCINENPEYGPCYRTYVMCATRESEALYWFNTLEGLGMLENYKAILNKGNRALELMPNDAEVANMLGALCGRCAYPWYSPFRLAAWWNGVPQTDELHRMAINFHTRAVENNPENLEYSCRLAQAYFMAGDYPNARRWFSKVRDEMPPQDLKDGKWQALAHTQLSTTFVKTRWNVPFS